MEINYLLDQEILKSKENFIGEKLIILDLLMESKENHILKKYQQLRQIKHNVNVIYLTIMVSHSYYKYSEIVMRYSLGSLLNKYGISFNLVYPKSFNNLQMELLLFFNDI